MPRKKRTIIDETIADGAPLLSGNDGAGISIDDIDLPELEDSTLQGIMSRLKGVSDYQIKIYQVTARGSEFRFNVDDTDLIDESYLQDVCGPGKYAIKILKDNILRKSFYLTIGAKPIGAGGIPTTTTSTDIAQLQAQMLRDQLAFTQNMLLSVLNKQETKHESTPMAELVSSLGILHGMNGNGNGNSNIDLFIRAMEIGKSMSSNSPDWKTALVDAVKDVTVAVGPTLAAAATKSPIQNGPMLPAGTTNEANNMAPSKLVEYGIKWIKSKIIAGMPVGLAVEWIMTNGNDPTYQPFIAMALRGNIDDLIKIDAEIANEPYRSWFTEALTSIKDVYNNAREQSDTDTIGEEGNTSNAVTHAKAG